MSFGPPVTGSPTQFNGQTLTASSGLITGSSRSQNVTQSFTISASVDAVLDINIFYSSSNGSPKVEWRNGKNSFLLAQFTSASLSGVPTIGGTGSYTASYFLGNPTFNNKFIFREIEAAGQQLDFTASFELRTAIGATAGFQGVPEYGDAAGTVTVGTIHEGLGDGRLWTPSELGTTFYSLWLDAEKDGIAFTDANQHAYVVTPRFTSDAGDGDYDNGNFSGSESTVGAYLINRRRAYNFGATDNGGATAAGYMFNKRVYNGADHPVSPTSVPLADADRHVFVVYSHYTNLSSISNDETIVGYGANGVDQGAFKVQTNKPDDSTVTNFLGMFTGSTQATPANGSVMTTSSFFSNGYIYNGGAGTDTTNKSITDTVIVESAFSPDSNIITMRKNGDLVLSFNVLSEGQGVLDTQFASTKQYGLSVNMDTQAADGGSPGGNYGSGDVGEILVFKQALTDAQREQVEGYLAWKWGAVEFLDARHTYKTAPPVIEWTIEEGAEPFPNGTADFVIYRYENFSSDYKRNTDQAPFRIATPGAMSLRFRPSAYSASIG
jgi:hypothetical protein